MGFISQATTFAADGDLDTTFDGDGKVTTAIGSGEDQAYGVAIQSDGKIVVAGRSWNGVNDDFAIVRYNTDGTPDASFDTDGKVTTAIGSGEDRANGVAIQSDGKIVVAGYRIINDNYDFAVVRYNTDGTPDASFDTDGKVTTAIGSGNDFAYGVAIQSDGKIVVAGRSLNGATYDFAVVRYNTDGSLDTTFDTDGKVTTDIGSSHDFAYGVAIQSDGKIVVAGYSIISGNYDVAVVRYNTDGSPDTGFDTDGKVTTDISSSDYANGVAIQSDGKIVVAGHSSNGVNFDFAVVRYNTNGSLDTTFDTDGKVTTAIGSGEDQANGVAIQSDGKIVVAGYSNISGNYDFAVVRYQSGNPTYVELLSFTGEANEDGTVTLAWETATEVDNGGFNLYRSRLRDGNYKKINDTLIPAQGDATAGASYHYEDTPPARGTYYYNLEDVDTHGVSTMHGPEKVKVKK